MNLLAVLNSQWGDLGVNCYMEGRTFQNRASVSGSHFVGIKKGWGSDQML